MTKAIILSGGYGTRLYPITNILNKQLLHIYDKPMIYYSLSFLINLGIKDIAIIVQSGTELAYKKILKNFDKGKINIKIYIQKKPDGIPMAFKICSKFISNDNVLLLLGDNFLFGKSLITSIKKIIQNNIPYIFVKNVDDPERYGVAKIKKNRVLDVVEKPKKFISNLAIIGLYYFDSQCSSYIKNLKKSKRGEYEILDLIKIYLNNKNINFYKLSDKLDKWNDLGTFDSMLKISNFIKYYQNRNNILIGSIEEALLNQKMINKKEFNEIINNYPKNSQYYQYLKKRYVL